MAIVPLTPSPALKFEFARDPARSLLLILKKSLMNAKMTSPGGCLGIQAYFQQAYFSKDYFQQTYFSNP